METRGFQVLNGIGQRIDLALGDEPEIALQETCADRAAGDVHADAVDDHLRCHPEVNQTQVPDRISDGTDTAVLLSIPAMSASIVEGMATAISELSSEPGW